MLSVGDVLAGVVLPAAVAGLLLLLARLFSARAWPAALALGCGYLAGHVGVRGWRGWMPKESSDWIAAGAAAGLVIGVLGLTRRGPGALRLGLRWVLAFAVAWFVAGRSLARRGDLPTVLGEMALIAAGAALAWSLLESARQAGGERPWARSPLVLLVATTSAAMAIGFSGSLVLARLCGVLAATLGAATIATRLRLAPALLPGAAGVVVLTLLSLLLAATVHARLPMSSALLVALAAPTALVRTPAPASASAQAADSTAGARRDLRALMLCALLGGAAVGIAYAASPPLEF